MKKTQVTYHNLANHERNRLKVLSESCLFQYIDRMGLTDNEKKLINAMCSNEKRFDEDKIADITNMLAKFKTFITEKLSWARKEFGDAKDENKPNSIIQNYKIYFDHLIEGYNSQLKSIDEMVEILTIESDRFDDEEYE